MRFSFEYIAMKLPRTELVCSTAQIMTFSTLYSDYQFWWQYKCTRLVDRQLNSLFLKPVTTEEVGNIMASLKDSSPGHDEMKIGPIRSVLNYIEGPLTYVCNLSLNEGIFPDILKIANVIPLYKKDDPVFFNNYRPVSLLCSLSKVLEKLMYNRVISFLDDNNILFKYQFGFRKSHSTYLALTILMDKLIKSIENGDHVVGVYLDFSKAFDTVNHTILLT